MSRRLRPNKEFIEKTPKQEILKDCTKKCPAIMLPGRAASAGAWRVADRRRTRSATCCGGFAHTANPARVRLGPGRMIANKEWQSWPPNRGRRLTPYCAPARVQRYFACLHAPSTIM